MRLGYICNLISIVFTKQQRGRSKNIPSKAVSFFICTHYNSKPTIYSEILTFEPIYFLFSPAKNFLSLPDYTPQFYYFFANPFPDSDHLHVYHQIFQILTFEGGFGIFRFNQHGENIFIASFSISSHVIEHEKRIGFIYFLFGPADHWKQCHS